MTLHYSDIASYQTGIDLAGEKAVAIKLTEGTGYVNPAYTAQHTEADEHHTWVMAYHFLLHGDATAQADYCLAQLAATGHPHTPVMVDAEARSFAAPDMPRGESRDAFTAETRRRGVGPGELRAALSASWSLPDVTDTAAFVQRIRDRGGACWLGYFPRWYYEQLGRPGTGPLARRGVLLAASDYQPYTVTGPGWKPYGDPPLPVAVWQYTSSATVNGMAGVDRNAFRGTRSPDPAVTLAEFTAVARSGALPSLAAYSTVTGASIAALLGWTYETHGRFPPWLAAYLQRGRLDQPVPFGTTLVTARP